MASPVSVDVAYRTLLQRGYSTTMAGNIVAEQLGLAKMPSPASEAGVPRREEDVTE